MIFSKEADFEEAVIKTLQAYGWANEVIKNPTEEDLLTNWANILYHNNQDIDRLNGQPLTNGEMQQLMEQINNLRTPLRLNEFINGKDISIKRDNPNDPAHLGKEISLKAFDRKEIAGGQSRYQIVQQPRFKVSDSILNQRRGDLMLLINGMPVFHIELKRSNVPVSQAINQIDNYNRSGVYSGIFSLVQICVAMTPEESRYFAHPGPGNKINRSYCFNWADINNEPILEWHNFTKSLLSIPMAHQLIGFYTIADENDGVLKVMRSYQYYAVNAISTKLARKRDWTEKDNLGGYIWHTTGSGKTMTSFKSAQLIANSKDADKVIFLMDRIELGTQSLAEYRNFAEASEEVQATENTYVLVTKLKSDSFADTLIVTSIQKMSNISEDDEGLKARDLDKMRSKRIVFIVDECHRSTFGDMLLTIKKTFPNAVFFGFTGTPIHNENKKQQSTTASVFGNELHRYSIADGIRDKNVLGFSLHKVLTYRDGDLRKAVALEKAKANTVEEAFKDIKKREVYNFYHNPEKVKMISYVNEDGKKISGIEDYIPTSQYEIEQHQKEVVMDILGNWTSVSQNNLFHSILATASIQEAIQYYQLFKTIRPSFKITALFDPHIDNTENAEIKEDGLVEIIRDYNEIYKQDFNLATHYKFKKDIANRLAHKGVYKNIGRNPELQLNLLIVVNQMLTGYDSKYINALYLDKELEYENIIQAFSRTNRLYGPEKPFGVVKYYRFPHTMEENINSAIKLYSGDKELGVFVDHLDSNLKGMNRKFEEISILFTYAGISDFEKLPDTKEEKQKFSKLFRELNEYLTGARIQGFVWSQLEYEFLDENKVLIEKIVLDFDEQTYLILALRYKELSTGTGGVIGDLPYEIETHLTEIDTKVINAEYMNSKFDKYLKSLENEQLTQEEKDKILKELHSTFATLTQEEQKYASLFLFDIQQGKAILQEGKTLRDYIDEYQQNAQNTLIRRIANDFGISENKLNAIMIAYPTEKNLNEYGRFDDLTQDIDISKAQKFFEQKYNDSIQIFKARILAINYLKDFVLRKS